MACILGDLLGRVRPSESKLHEHREKRRFTVNVSLFWKDLIACSCTSKDGRVTTQPTTQNLFATESAEVRTSARGVPFFTKWDPDL